MSVLLRHDEIHLLVIYKLIVRKGHVKFMFNDLIKKKLIFDSYHDKMCFQIKNLTICISISCVFSLDAI